LLTLQRPSHHLPALQSTFSFSKPEHIMSEYTSTRDGFQRAMQWSLTGPPEETKVYAEATTLPTFYHIMNGHKLDYDAYIAGIQEWRAKISEYKPDVSVKTFYLFNAQSERSGKQRASSTAFRAVVNKL
jgi:hypothetical protein